MTFSSILFLFFFLPAALLFCRYDVFIPPSVKRRMSVQTKKKHFKIENLFILIFSLFFYGWGEPKYIVIMIFTILLNYICALLIHSNRTKGKQGAAKAVLVVSVILNLGILGFFKYFNFFLTNINNIFGLDIQFLKLALPIGISFYTFQTMSYPIDVYRGDTEEQKNFIRFGTFVALFPQLIAGPIVRYKDVASQLGTRRLSSEQFSSGVQRFAIGLGKKVLLANNIGALWDIYAAAPELSFAGAWLGALAFSLQLYFDFSGYSDMAIGLGRMLGFEFLENFNYPYISKSVTEFWRRWHMSLGTWFRDYLYIPLGGNRRGLPRQILNILIVWALTGLWHGANWTFLLWGLYYAVFLILEKVFLLKKLEKVPVLAHIYALLVAVVGWMLFQLNSVGEVVHYWGAMFGASGAAATTADAFYARSYAVILFIAAIAATPVPKKLFQRIPQRVQNVLTPVLVALCLVISTAYLVDATYNPFLYFRF